MAERYEIVEKALLKMLEEKKMRFTTDFHYKALTLIG